MLKGYINEFDFCRRFNNISCYELDNFDYKFIRFIFGRMINKDSYINCYKNPIKEKGDIIIECNGIKKYISIKSGKNNSIHVEKLSTFIGFLKELGCSMDIINIYINYHNGIYNNNRICGKEYQELYSDELDKFNKFINNKNNIIKAIDRFLIKGRYCRNRVDYFIYGTISDYKYCSRDDIIKYLVSRKDIFLTPHFSSITIQPWDRNICNNPLYEYRREYVQMKWYRLDMVFDEIFNK